MYYTKFMIPLVRMAEPSNHERFAEEGYFV
jgi:hypothetical protein